MSMAISAIIDWIRAKVSAIRAMAAIVAANRGDNFNKYD